MCTDESLDFIRSHDECQCYETTSLFFICRHLLEAQPNRQLCFSRFSSVSHVSFVDGMYSFTNVLLANRTLADLAMMPAVDPFIPTSIVEHVTTSQQL